MHRSIMAVVTILILTGCAGYAGNHPNDERKQSLPELEDYGPAPELYNQTWLNTDVPLRLADLQGKVVLLEMWTFG